MIELMRERIIIQKSSTKKDGTGNHTLVWSDHYKCYSYVNNLSSKEYWEAKQVNAETELDFVIRYCSEISALDTEHFRILFRGNIYNITFIDNVQYKNKTVKIRAALAIMDGLKEYADLATDTVKDAVKDVSKTVKKDIQANAPKRTGRYKKSWAVKKTAESSNSLTMTVHSKDRYQIAHLLEHGHAKRGGGRVAGREHIAPAEERGNRELVQKIERGLRS